MKPEPNFQGLHTQRKLVSIGQLLPEQLIAVRRKCGKSNCHCQRLEYLSHQS